ncbi:hypothetical protein O204_05655 [Pseudomonas simiae]|uniref:Uncharacterized protein n=1 Tax=Pseudomonas simiae TaxID=321846 RepID=U1UJR6_9PSED|nr:hypothetical protein O204_05655 [Pseudomonas simiae]
MLSFSLKLPHVGTHLNFLGVIHLCLLHQTVNECLIFNFVLPDDLNLLFLLFLDFIEIYRRNIQFVIKIIITFIDAQKLSPESLLYAPKEFGYVFCELIRVIIKVFR